MSDQAPAKTLTTWRYLGYGAGDVANNLTFSMASAFLLIYYTDVAGIAAGTAGTIFLVVRIWGGLTDLFAGARVDRTSTRWGRFRPYILFGAIPLMATNIALFTIPSGLNTAIPAFTVASLAAIGSRVTAIMRSSVTRTLYDACRAISLSRTTLAFLNR